MSSPDPLTAELQRGLIRAGLVDPGTYEECRVRVRMRSDAELAQLAQRVGEPLWSCGIPPLNFAHGERDMARVLGFGYSLTELFVLPLALPLERQQAVARLGALTNGIVAIFDRCLDSHDDPETVLSRATLRRLSDGDVSHDGNATGANALLARLVALYFQDLATLPYSAHHPEVHRCILRAIWRMYDAERRTTGPEPVSQSTYRRKSGLPFVVMGLHGWLASETVCAHRVRAHLVWLYRCGDFLGWVDDVIDLQEDRRYRRANRVQACHGSRSVIAQRVTDMARRLVRDWQAMTGNVGVMSLRSVLGTCLLSWFGGVAPPGRSRWS